MPTWREKVVMGDNILHNVMTGLNKGSFILRNISKEDLAKELDKAVDEINRAHHILEEAAVEKRPTIYIKVEGGVIQGMWSDCPEGVRVVTVDIDRDADEHYILHDPYEVFKSPLEEIERWIKEVKELIEEWNKPLPPYFEGNCTCRPIQIHELDRVMIGGEDDCPVHGFKIEYVIYCGGESKLQEEPMFWADNQGWVDFDSADRYLTDVISLPIGDDVRVLSVEEAEALLKSAGRYNSFGEWVPNKEG